jgi:hypothetical protein
MVTKILNAKVSPNLKEAVRIIAFRRDNSNSSLTIKRILESDPDIAAELKKMKQCFKK